VILWDVQSKKLITSKAFAGVIQGSFSSGGDELVTVGYNQPIIIWDSNSLATAGGPKQIVAIGQRKFRWLTAVSFDGKWIATVGEDGLLLWSRSEPKKSPVKLRGHMGDVRWIQFSPNSDLLVTASEDRTARIWSVLDPSQSKVLSGHTGAVLWASFHPSKRQVVTSGSDGTIRVWGIDTSEELATLRWHAEGVNQVQFSPDGKWILSASDDGTVMLGKCDVCDWRLAELLKKTREYAELSPEELENMKRETNVTMRWLSLPNFLFSSR
jgi:WD40 repeat protein